MSFISVMNYLFFSLILMTAMFTIDAREIATTETVWNAQQYFEQKLKFKSTQATSLEPKLNGESPSPVKFHTKMYLGIFHAKFGFRDQYMALCDNKEDCDAGIRMICKDKKCSCRTGELFFEWPKFGCFIKAHMFERCEVSGQCMAMNPHTYCNPENNKCTCSPNYFFNGQECSMRYDATNLKAQEVYKAAVVAAACFIVAVVGIFVACIVRRSFCRREQQLQQSESNRNSDIFSISEEIAALRAVDKPPSYEEVLQIERTFYGIPPPEYSGPRSDTSSHSLQLCTASNSALPDAINPPFNQDYQSSAVATSSRCSSLSEDMKETTSNAANFNDNTSDNSHLQTINMSDLVTAAEVLPVPSDMDSPSLNISPLLSGTPSHSAHSYNHSTTPPPPRLHRHCLKSEHFSSSLPSSPYLSSISSKVDTAFANLHAIARKELLKQESETTQPETSHLTQDSFVSHSETSSVVSMPHEISTNKSTSEYDHSVTVIAYDNLGFESDLYL